MNSINNFYSSNRSYRHCINTDFEEKNINHRYYQTPSITEFSYSRQYNDSYSRQHDDSHFHQKNMDNLNSYEKLLNNLSVLSGVINNFFSVLQGVLGLSIDTLFTDYSTTNVIQIDKRLQIILKILLRKFQM